jgi:phosphatidylglycerophosphate synthase
MRAVPLPPIVSKEDASPLTPIAVTAARRLVPALPDWTTPNQVTVFGCAMLALAGACMYLAGYERAWFAAGCALCLLHWLCDSVDGELAARRGLRSERGFFLDLFLDQVGLAGLLLGIAASSYASFAVFGTYEALILLRSLVLLHRICFRQEFSMPFPGMSEVPFLLIALSTLQALAGPPPFAVPGLHPSWFDTTGVVLVVLMVVDVARATIAKHSQ